MGGQGYDLGNVYGKITLDASGIADGINKARQSLASGFANMGNSIQSFGDQITGLGARITALSAPFAAFSASGLNVASDFDALMKQIELFGGVTGAELEEVRQFALKWGADTKFSAQDTGQAFLELLKSGMNLEEAMATLPDVLNLAAAGELSLAQSASVVSSSLAMFQMDVTGLTEELEQLEKRYGITEQQFNDFAIDGSIEDGLRSMSEQLGITREDWSNYWSSLFIDVESVNPAIQELADATGISATHIMELVSSTYKRVADPTAFMELQKQLGITDAMFTEWLNEDLDAPPAIVEMANQLGVAINDIGGMWANTKFVTPELKEMATQLGITGEQWEALRVDMVDNFAGEGSQQITTAMREMAEASGLSVSHLMMLFTQETSASTRTINAFAQAANASRADVADLAEAFANVGPLANTFELSIEETAAVLAVFSQNSIEGAEAGTQLKSMLTNITRQTDDVKEAWDELGVSFYDSNGEIRDFNTVILELDSALEKLSPEERNAYIQTLGGSFGSMGLTALLASDGIGDMLEQMEAAPEAGLLATEMMNTFQGKVISLQGSMETLKIEAFTPFMNDVLKPFIDRMIVLVNNMAQWAKENPDLTKTLLQIGSAVVVAGPALVGMGFAINNIGFAIKAFAPVVGLLTSPLGLMAGAGLALAHVFDIDLRQAFEDALEVIQPILEGLYVWFVEEGMPAITDFIQNTALPIIGQIGRAIAQVWADVSPTLSRLYNWFVNDAIPAIADIIQTVFIPIVQDIGKRIGEIWAVIQPVLAQIYEWFITTAIPAIASMIETVFIPAVQGIAHIFNEIYQTVAPILNFLIEWFVTQAVPIIAGLINDVIIPAVRTFMDVLSAIWNAVAPALQSLVDWFQASGWPFIENIINTIITPAINIFVELLKGIWNLVEPVINLLVDWFEAIIAPAIQLAVDAVTIVIDTFIAIFTGIWGSVEPALNSLRDWFNVTIVPIIQSAIDLIRPIISELERIIGDIWTNIEPFVNGLRDGLSAIFTWIRDHIIQPVIDLILSIPRAVEEARRALDIFNGNAEIVQKTREKAGQVGATYDQVYANAHNEVSAAFGGGFFGDLAARVIAPGMTSQVVPSRDSGGIGLADMPYLIGKPQEDNEIYVPRTSGTFIPNFMEKMDALFERENTPSIGTVIVNANTEEGGRAAARGFVDEFERTLRSKG